MRQYPNGAFRALAQNRQARLAEPAGGLPPGDRPEAAQFGGDPECTRQPDGVPCWMEVATRRGCYVWNPNPQPDEAVTWTGECSGGFAEGTGSLTWAYSGTQEVATGGRVRDGKMDGRWTVTVTEADGRVSRRFEATFADGRPQRQEPSAAPAGQSAESQEQQPPPPRPSSAAGRACEIPGYPSPADVASLGLRWCGSNVGFKRRAFALQAAGA